MKPQNESPSPTSNKTLTNRQGHPVYDNKNSKTVGDRGPVIMENYNFFEKMGQFNRERIPERMVHPRGAGAHGYFEAYGKIGDEPASKFTRAKLFQEAGKRTPVFVRFSTVIHSSHSPETLRDPRGFATKFYTEDGNWDLVCNNLPVFFIRDAIKFPDLVHAFKPDPINNRQSGHRIFDYVAKNPETLNMTTWLLGPRGIPASYREMEGFGVNTFKFINSVGESVLVKFSWHPKCGVRTLTYDEACAIQATNFNHATQDLYETIESGDYPEFELRVQMMSDDAHPELDFDPLDATKLWPKDQFPRFPVGKLVLDRNPSDYFSEVEQAAFGPGVLVDGIGFSNDRLLVGRAFSYSDTQRYRVGPNYLQLPINRPKCRVATNQRAGPMTYYIDNADTGIHKHSDYQPSTDECLEVASQPAVHEEFVSGPIGQQSLKRADDHFQPGQYYREMDQSSKDQTVFNFSMFIGHANKIVQELMVGHLTKMDVDLGSRVAKELNIPVPSMMSDAAE